MVKNLPADAGDIKDLSSIPELERSPGGGYGNPLLYSCLENPMDRGNWQATAHRDAKSLEFRGVFFLYIGGILVPD